MFQINDIPNLNYIQHSSLELKNMTDWKQQVAKRYVQ